MTWLLGLAFLILKFGVEWHQDFAAHLFPDTTFAIDGPAGGGARLFFVFYFVSTALHGIHMLAGLVLVGWLIDAVRRREITADHHTPVVVIGLYWSFVDMVWITLYPMIYLVGRGS